jgi:hypothetical protein
MSWILALPEKVRKQDAVVVRWVWSKKRPDYLIVSMTHALVDKIGFRDVDHVSVEYGEGEHAGLMRIGAGGKVKLGNLKHCRALRVPGLRYFPEHAAGPNACDYRLDDGAVIITLPEWTKAPSAEPKQAAASDESPPRLAFAGNVLVVGNKNIRFDPDPAKLLKFLIAHPGKILTRAKLHDELFGHLGGSRPPAKVIDTHVDGIMLALRDTGIAITDHGGGFSLQAAA